jgi:DNA-binding CsgD family transcriptional regulator
LARPEDFAVAQAFVPSAYRYAPRVREALPAVWAQLLRAGQLNTAVVEDPSLPAGDRVRGVGLSVFVTDDFADAVLRLPTPYLNARLHEMILAGRSPILTRPAIAEANTNRGLTLMPLHFATPSVDCSDPVVMRTLAAGQDLFRLVHAGYRIRRIIKEVVDINLCRFMQSSGMRLFTDYSDTRNADWLRDVKSADRPYLLAVDHVDLPLGSSLSMMFITGAARFRFSPAEQKVLLCALLHERDEDVATDLGVSLDTLRKHWRSIYERVQFADPLFFPDEPRTNGRGRGKRRHLLRHLLMHMEELRPYREPAAGARRRGRAAEVVLAQSPR